MTICLDDYSVNIWLIEQLDQEYVLSAGTPSGVIRLCVFGTESEAQQAIAKFERSIATSAELPPKIRESKRSVLSIKNPEDLAVEDPHC